jgi:CDP-diglyceride synthetase
MGRLAMIRKRLPPLSAEREVAGFCAALLGSSAVMLAFTSYLQRPSIFLLIASSIAMMIFVPRRAKAPKVVEPVRQPDGPLTA